MKIVHWDQKEQYERIYNLRGEHSTYVAYIRGYRCMTHLLLHAEVSAALQFPSYYGENPNALAECLEDLEWLNSSHVYVIIDQAECFLRFDAQEENMYCRIFMRAEDYWRSQGQTFQIILNTISEHDHLSTNVVEGIADIND